MNSTFQDSIGRLLLSETDLSEKDLQQAREAQGRNNEKLGRILVRQKSLTEQDLLAVWARHFGLRMVDRLPPPADSEFTQKLPITFLKKNLMVPTTVDGSPAIAVNDPHDLMVIDDVRRQLMMDGCRIVLSTEGEIIRTINSAYDMVHDSTEQVIQDIDEEDTDRLFSEIEKIEDLLDDTSDSPVIRLVNLMLSQAVRSKVSDIHIEPYQNNVKIRQRLDGVLYDMSTPPKHVQSALISRIKLMAKMNIAEKRLPQDGRIEIKVGNRDIDIRVSTLPTVFGERVVMRLLDKSNVRMSLQDLGMSPDYLNVFSEIIHAPNGIVLVTGPTGSGKTTTLYAALSEINNVDINIITVEDPIEYRIPGIGQVQVNPKIDLTFASGLRSIVRQDPDVILIGEIRDLETAEIAIQSALTGHLVFSTLHTNDAPSSITRLRDMGVESFLLASSINAIIAQRLVRVVCPSCREPYEPDPHELARIGLSPGELTEGVIYRGRGCEACLNTGYRGRTGIHEFLVMDESTKKLVLQTSDANQIKKHACSMGMKTLLQHGSEKVVAGETTIEEVYRVAQS